MVGTSRWPFLAAVIVHAAVVAAGPALSDDIIDAVNHGASWRAHRSANFEGWSIHQVQSLLGVTSPMAASGDISSAQVAASAVANATFDARTEWPGCIGPIRDQGDCGACWAMAAAEAMSDRLCISSSATEGVAQFVRLSAMDLTSCDAEGENMGCLGGVPLPAWEYAHRSGIVTDACLPYLKADGGTIDTCDPQPNCSLDKHDSTPYCTQMCTSNSSRQYDSDKHHLSSAYSVESDTATIAAEIRAHGPVEVTFAVYQDFLHYKSGVYSHVSGPFMGKHAVKVIGFGFDAESKSDYWLIANSWSKNWGDGGFFKIAKGVNECSIESEVTAGLFSARPDVVYHV